MVTSELRSLWPHLHAMWQGRRPKASLMPRPHNWRQAKPSKSISTRQRRWLKLRKGQGNQVLLSLYM